MQAVLVAVGTTREMDWPVLLEYSLTHVGWIGSLHSLPLLPFDGAKGPDLQLDNLD